VQLASKKGVVISSSLMDWRRVMICGWSLLQMYLWRVMICWCDDWK